MTQNTRPRKKKDPVSPEDAAKDHENIDTDSATISSFETSGTVHSEMTEPEARWQPPSNLVLTLSVIGATGFALASFILLGTAATPLAAVGLAFFSGALAVWRILTDDRMRVEAYLAEKDSQILHLQQQCEALQDKTWELGESDERHSSILSTLGDVVIRRNAERKVVYANQAAVAAFGCETSTVCGQEFTFPRASITGHEHSASFLQKDDGRLGFGDLWLETNTGPRWFSRVDVSVRDSGSGEPLLQTVLRDVTERRLIENELLAARHSAESSNEAKSRFLATVSHEIRTPLNGILGMATLLRDTRLTKEQKAYIEALETSGETLLLLIDEVLDFSKVEAGKLQIQTAPAELTSLAQGVVEILAPRAHAKGLEIGMRIAANLPATVSVDATRVRQILFNLTGNAVKFTDTGGVAIEIDGKSNPDGGTFLEICVRDTGIGFKSDEAERLFMEFEQIDHGPTRKFGGTGLGLAIVRRLTTLMGGQISAEPGKNGGAVFRLVLPVPETMPSSEALARQSGNNRCVVLISSGTIEAPLIQSQLEAEGAVAHLRAPGAEDLADLLMNADLVIMDNSCVGDSGGWLASARLAGCTAPAVVLVSPPERDRLERLRSAGYAAYLIRPVRMTSLFQILNRLLENTDSEDACWNITTTPETDITSTENQRTPARPMRLLVAEDNDINRLLGEALLRKLGHEPTLVVDGEKAVSAAQKTRFDAILMDLHMPGLDGIDAIEQIRKDEAKKGEDPVPVLIVTADVMQDAQQRAKKVGAAGYLTKPLSAEAIQQALASLTLS